MDKFDKPYDWRNHVDLAPYAGHRPDKAEDFCQQQMLQVPPYDPLTRAQEALAKAEAQMSSITHALYADSTLVIREPVPPVIEVHVGKASVKLVEDEAGYLHVAGENLTEAAAVFFNEVVAHHCLALGALRRERDELVAEVADWRAKDRHSREACVPDHLIPDRGVKGF